MEDPWLVMGKAACTQPVFFHRRCAKSRLHRHLPAERLPTDVETQHHQVLFDRAALLAQRPEDLQAEQQALAEAAELARQKTEPATATGYSAGSRSDHSRRVVTGGRSALPAKQRRAHQTASSQGYDGNRFHREARTERRPGKWGSSPTCPSAQPKPVRRRATWDGARQETAETLLMVSLSGTYRISAQVSLPRPTGWSVPVEFVVTAPNKAIQKAPKMFGP